MMMGTAASQVLIACGSRMRYLGANNFIFREIAQGINSIVQSQPAVTCFSSLIAVASPSQASQERKSLDRGTLRHAARNTHDGYCFPTGHALVKLFLIPEEQFDQCRLARTIWSDKADTVTAFNI